MAVRYQAHKSTIFGLDANIVAALSYVASVILGMIPVVGTVAWLAPLIVYLVEKQSNFVKKHAMQAFLLGCVTGAAGLLFMIVSLMSGFTGLASTVTAGIAGAEAAAAGSAIAMLLPLLIFGLLFLVLALLVLIAKIFGIIGAAKYEEVKIPLVTKLTEKITGLKNN